MEPQEQELDAVGQGPALDGGADGDPKAPVERPAPAPERAALVKQILATIKADEKHFESRFKRMREDMKFAGGLQWAGQKDRDDPRYVANIAQRHVGQRVSSLYAKNPTAVARRRKRMEFTLWDGKPESLMRAQQTMMMAQQTDPAAIAAASVQAPEQAQAMMQQVADAQALMQDVMEAQARIQMYERIGETMVCLFHYYMGEGQPAFKLRAKQLVRRVVTCGVGYIKLGFQRINGAQANPDIGARIADFTDRIAAVKVLADGIADGEHDPHSAQAEELRLALAALQQESDVIVREGLMFDFLRATSVIPDAETVELKGWVGSGHLSLKYVFSPAKVKQLYGVDLKSGTYTGHTKSGSKRKSETFAAVYEYYNKDTGLMYTVADGYCDFLEEPIAPPIEIEQFFPVFVLSFNDIEDEDEIFPPSDIELIQHPCREVNRSREGLRQHRIANTPQYATGVAMDELDKEKLASGVPHAVLDLKALIGDRKVEDVLQMIKKHPIDPTMYDAGPQKEDILLIVGNQEANYGQTSGATATESSIAEGSRLASTASCIDDVDDFLGSVFRAAGQVLLKEISVETAKKIVGPGAVWPEFSRMDIAEELYLEIEMGSSGKPNKAQDIQNWERITPLLIQVPGITPQFIAKKLVGVVDDKIDLSEAYLEGLPSITSMNAAKTPQAVDGQQQGGEGGNNQEKPPEQEGSGPGGQPGAMMGV